MSGSVKSAVRPSVTVWNCNILQYFTAGPKCEDVRKLQKPMYNYYTITVQHSTGKSTLIMTQYAGKDADSAHTAWPGGTADVYLRI